MSSHHIVKDEQEPALIIANGESCSEELLNQLLEWNPYILVLDGAINRVKDLGIKIDVLLGDFDSRERNDDFINSQLPVEIVHTPDQNKTDLHKGIEFLISRNHKAVNVVWATGKRADHTLSNITDIVRYKSKINIVLHDDNSRVFCIPKKFEKWYSKGTNISLMPIAKVTAVNTLGLMFNLVKEDLNIGYRTGSSNKTIDDGIVKIEYEEGDLLLMECID